MVVELSAFLGAFGAAAGKAAGTEATKLLQELAGLQSAQVELLRSVDAKLDLLLAGPFKQGCLQLEDAQAAEDPEDRRRLLREARNSFTECLAQDPEPMRRSLAALHLAVIGAALGFKADTERNLRRAHIEAFKAIGTEAKKPMSLRQKVQERIKAEDKRQRMLESELQVLAFANTLAETRRAWGSPPNEAPLVISQYGEDTAGQPDEVANLARRISTWRFLLLVRSFDIPKDVLADIDPPDHVLGDKRKAFERLREQGVLTSFDIFGHWLPAREPE